MAQPTAADQTLPSTSLTVTTPMVAIVVTQTIQWTPEAIFGITFGLITVLIGLPGAMIAFHTLRKYRRVRSTTGVQDTDAVELSAGTERSNLEAGRLDHTIEEQIESEIAGGCMDQVHTGGDKNVSLTSGRVV